MLDAVLAEYRLTAPLEAPYRGIMNGIDMVEWDPAADAHLPGPVHFTATTAVNGKKLAKAVLQVTRRSKAQLLVLCIVLSAEHCYVIL